MPYREIIKDIMTSHDLSQQQLADILGVHQTTVSQWLQGKKKPGYDSIRAFYEKFGVEPNLFFGVGI